MKNLKQLVRSVVDPNRDLGHVDRDHVGKKRGPTSDGKSTLSQSSTEKAEESTLHYRQTTFSTNISETPQDSQEQAIPVDADTAVANVAASEEVGEQGTREENRTGGGELCTECM